LEIRFFFYGEGWDILGRSTPLAASSSEGVVFRVLSNRGSKLKDVKNRIQMVLFLNLLLVFLIGSFPALVSR